MKGSILSTTIVEAKMWTVTDVTIMQWNDAQQGVVISLLIATRMAQLLEGLWARKYIVMRCIIHRLSNSSS